MGSTAERTAHSATDSKGGKALIAVGLVAYGLMHLVVAWIAIQIAWGGSSSGQEASQQGALQELASTPVGGVLMWVVVVGMAALVLWQAAEAIWGYREHDSGKRLRKRLGSAGKAVVYALLGWSALRIAIGEGSSGGDTEESMTARFMSSGFGRIAVGVAGAVVIGFGIRLVVRGVKKKFLEELTGTPGQGVQRLGQVGFIAKGVALALVGGLFVWAAISYDAEKAGGMDDALRTLAGAPAGAVLLTAMALGIAAFGVYCFAWARHAKA